MATITTLQGGSYVVMEPAALAQFIRSPDGPLVRHMITLGERVKQEAIRQAPVKTGNLRAHIVKRVVVADDGQPAVLVGVENVDYAIWVHEGSQPHDIVPRNAPALVFYWDRVGAVVSFPPFGGGVVHHPGNAPNRFLIRALAAART